MTSFLSRMNMREDSYGGPLDRKLRLLLEVFAAVRASVRPDFIVGCRFLAEECIDGGNRLDETPAIGVAFATAGMDFVSSSLGGKFEDAARPAVMRLPPVPIRAERLRMYVSVHFGRARTVRAQRRAHARNPQRLRGAGFGTPVVCTGGVHNFEMAESWLADGSLRRRRRSAVVPRRSRRDAKDLARPRRGSAHLTSTRTIARCSIKNTRWLPANSGTSSTSTLLTHCSRRKENDGLSCRIGRCQQQMSGVDQNKLHLCGLRRLRDGFTAPQGEVL